jgi:hypothetical protein
VGTIARVVGDKSLLRSMTNGQNVISPVCDTYTRSAWNFVARLGVYTLAVIAILLLSLRQVPFQTKCLGG